MREGTILYKTLNGLKWEVKDNLILHWNPQHLDYISVEGSNKSVVETDIVQILEFLSDVFFGNGQSRFQ